MRAVKLKYDRSGSICSGQTKNQQGKASAKRALLNFNYYSEETYFM